MQSNYAKLNSDDLKIITEAQSRLNKSTGKEIVLIAYEI